MVSGKKKSQNLTNNFLRIEKGLKKKAFEFSMLDVGVVVGGLKKKRNLIQNHPAQIGVASSSEQDDVWSVVQERSLIQALKELIPKGKDVIVTNQRCWEHVATAVPGKKKKTANQCKKKFALLVRKGFSFN